MHIQTVYDPGRSSLKIIIAGAADGTANLLSIISVLTGGRS